MPTGCIVHGDPRDLGPIFGALIGLQPLRWTPHGLLCAPWIDPLGAAAARATCPAPISPAPAPPLVPDSPARLVSGWYRRTDLHAPAPPGVRELVQVAGEGFGPGDHPTTAMCLAAIDGLPPGRAVDVGCGSGLLAQAWVAAGHGDAVGVDADPAAVRQAVASAAASGRDADLSFTVGRIESLDPNELAEGVVLANLPPIAHAALRDRLTRAPRAFVACGTTRLDAAATLDHARRLGMRRARTLRAGRWVCHVLVRP